MGLEEQASDYVGQDRKREDAFYEFTGSIPDRIFLCPSRMAQEAEAVKALRITDKHEAVETEDVDTIPRVFVS